MKIYILDIMQKILKIIDLTTGAVLAVIPNRAWQAESFGLYASTWSIEKAIGVEIYTHIKKKKKTSSTKIDVFAVKIGIKIAFSIHYSLRQTKPRNQWNLNSSTSTHQMILKIKLIME